MEEDEEGGWIGVRSVEKGRENQEEKCLRRDR